MPYLYKLKKDTPDSRDVQFHEQITQNDLNNLPSSIDLRTTKFIPSILDQGDLGSCTANASSNALRFLLKKEKTTDFQPSRLFIYFFARFIEGNPYFDTGATLRNTMKEIHTFGACSEPEWPYDISKYDQKPPLKSIRDAKIHTKNFQYLSVKQDLQTIKNALYNEYPVVFGMSVYDSFEGVDKSGIVPLPDTNNENFLGLHALSIYGFDDSKKHFIVMNSWGIKWGDAGFCYIPYDYLLNKNLASDFWAVRFFN